MDAAKGHVLGLPPGAWRALRPLMMLTTLGVGLGCGLYWWVLGPAQERLVQSQRVYQAVRKEQVELQRNRGLQEEVQRQQAILNKVWDVLPNRKDFTSLGVAIAELARAGQVTLPGMQYQSKNPKSGLPAKASFTFQARGHYRDLFRFIHSLETTKQYMVIESLGAARARASEQDKAGSVNLTIQVVTFLKPDLREPDRL